MCASFEISEFHILDLEELNSVSTAYTLNLLSLYQHSHIITFQLFERNIVSN